MRIHTTLPIVLAVALAACQGSPTAPSDVRPLNSAFVGSGSRDEPAAAPAGSVYIGAGNAEQEDSAPVNSTFLGSGNRDGEGDDTGRSPAMGGSGG